MTLGGVTLPQFSMYRTSAGENCVQAGTVTGPTLSLPASSITTLYGSGYAVGTTVPVAPERSASPKHVLPGRMVDLAGRTVADRHSPRVSAGVYLTQPSMAPARLRAIVE